MIDDHNIFNVFISDSIGCDSAKQWHLTFFQYVLLYALRRGQKEEREKGVTIDKTSSRTIGRPFFLSLSWPASALVSHNDKRQRLMKQRGYIITPLMRQLTAGGGKREQDRLYGGRDG